MPQVTIADYRYKQRRCSYLYEAEDVENVIEGQDAVVHSHQTAQPGGRGNQQKQEGVADSSTVCERERERTEG